MPEISLNLTLLSTLEQITSKFFYANTFDMSKDQQVYNKKIRVQKKNNGTVD